MKKIIKKTIINLGLKDFVMLLLNFYYLPIILILRLIIYYRLSWHTIDALRKTQVITFPSSLHLDYNLRNHGYVLEKILIILGIKTIPFNPWTTKKNTIYIDWQDLTINAISSNAYLEAALEYKNMKQIYIDSKKINQKASDISKTNVSECFNKVFGYPLTIDPLTYDKPIVIKSESNGHHDGIIINGPLKPDQIQTEKNYSIEINNIDKNGYATDYRIPYIGGISNFCYLKKRPKSTRFSNNNERVFLLDTKENFSKSEMLCIEDFCRLIGLDYGELDCLRDNLTKKLYIVDVAKTPAGPPNGIKIIDRYKALLKMSVMFAEKFIA